MMKLDRIGVDLDGTLCEESDYTPEGFANAKPRTDSIKLVDVLHRMGCHIIIWTGRDSELREITLEWLRKNNVKYHELVMDKLHVDVYIDEGRKLLPIANCEKHKDGV